MTAREIRLFVGYSLEKTAVLGGVTSQTLRLYEANRFAVSASTRGKLDRFFRTLVDMLAAERSAFSLRISDTR